MGCFLVRDPVGVPERVVFTVETRRCGAAEPGVTHLGELAEVDPRVGGLLAAGATPAALRDQQSLID
jgi:hypothetical protein